MKDYIVFGNYSSIDSGTLIFPKEIDNAPKRDVEKIQVPGRNGSLIIDNGRYEDVKQSYVGIIYDHARFDEYITKLKSGLLGSAGYKRLSVFKLNCESIQILFLKISYFNHSILLIFE